jgi:hypothetical protein
MTPASDFELPADRSVLHDIVDAVVRPSPAPFGAYVFAHDHPGARLGRALEGAVFEEAFGNDAQLLAAEYGPYEDASVFVVVIDHVRRLPAACCRLVLPGGRAGLKSVNDLSRGWCSDPADLLAAELPQLRSETTWDWATLAVDPDYRSPHGYGIAALGLYQTIGRTATRVGARHVLAILDAGVYRMQRLRFVQPFVAFGPARPYLGSLASFPVCMDLETWGERLALVDPELYSIIFQGRGIEPALQPADLEAAVAALPLAARR